MAAKKLARKLAKMSEEERAIFLEKQRQEEEEAQKKKEEMLSRFLKDKLAKEENASKLNMVKLQNQWRAIMRKGKHKYGYYKKYFPRLFNLLQLKQKN